MKKSLAVLTGVFLLLSCTEKGDVINNSDDKNNLLKEEPICYIIKCVGECANEDECHLERVVQSGNDYIECNCEG